MTEDLVELRWSDLSLCNSPALSSFEVFLQYQEEEYGEWDPSEEDRQRKQEDQIGTKNQSTPKKIVRVPISISSRGVTLAGLSPGSIYSFTLQASHPPGFAWSLGQTQIAYTSECIDNHLHNSKDYINYINIGLYRIIFIEADF